MRAGRATFLLCLALIHISLADTSTDEEPTELADEEPKELTDKAPKELTDEVVYKNGYVFDGHKVFAYFADLVIKHIAQIMGYCMTRECRYFTYCTKMYSDSICIDIRLTNSTHFEEDLRDLETLESRPAFLDRYPYNKNLTFATNLHTLLMYSMLLMESCTTEDCRYYTYCTKVGYDIVCLSITFGNYTESLAEALNITANPLLLKHGYIFDEDEIFAKESEHLLNYSTQEMRKCTTESCRTYMLCRKVDHDAVCLSVQYINARRDNETFIPGVENPNLPEIEDNFISNLVEENKRILEGELKNQSKEDEDEEQKEDRS